MDLVTVDDIKAAAHRIEGKVFRTPLVQAPWAPGDLWLKPENLQPIGAFKLRGALNALARLSPAVRARGVVTHSSGNHGQAVAWAARTYGVPAVVVMPEGSAEVKRTAIRALGAEVVLVPASERATDAAAEAEERGAVIIPPFDHHDVIAGQGTAGLELTEDLPDADTVLVPVGGGGLISGIAVAVKELTSQVRVVGVEPELAADVAESMAAGERVAWDVDRTFRTVADGVRTTVVGELTWPHISKYVDEVITVSEDQILDAVGLLARRSRLVAEPSGALATAGYLADPERFGTTVAVISGGNIDPVLLSAALGRGY